MLTQLSLLDTDSFTSSPASADGPLQPVLPDGRTTASLSPGRARVSRSQSRGRAPELLMRGTYGPTFSESSVPEGPLSSWENRLRQRLAKVGSSECDLTWKVSGTTPGELLSRLVPSTPRTVEIASGLLLEAAYWVTCTTRDHKDTPGMSLTRSDGRSRCDQLPRQVAATAAYWSTPRASDGEKGGPNQAFGAGGQPLPAQAFHTAMWPSPTLPSGGQTWPEGTTLEGKRPDGKKSQVTLNNVVTGLWPTPLVGSTNPAAHNQISGQWRAAMEQAMPGPAQSGSLATTEKRGVLNPAFPCWLMGYPIAWVYSGALAMQSCRKLPRK